MKLKGIISFFSPYSVIVEFWNNSVVTHKATSFSDALQWASCYPNDCVVNINWHRMGFGRGRRVAMVGQR